MAQLQLFHIVERAFQLAKTGKYVGASEIGRGLINEGYMRNDVRAHLHPPSIQRNLSDLCREAQGKPRRGPPVRAAASPKTASSSASADFEPSPA